MTYGGQRGRERKERVFVGPWHIIHAGPNWVLGEHRGCGQNLARVGYKARKLAQLPPMIVKDSMTSSGFVFEQLGTMENQAETELDVNVVGILLHQL